jgi:hypothetical protein
MARPALWPPRRQQVVFSAERAHSFGFIGIRSESDAGANKRLTWL